MKGYTIQHSIDLLEKKVEAGGSGGSTAADITYDNTSSHMTADDVQEAIDELKNDIVTVAASVPTVSDYGQIFSTDEREVGTYTDGSKIYQKTFTGLSLQLDGANWVKYEAIDYIENVLDVEAYNLNNSVLTKCAISETQVTSLHGVAISTYGTTFNRVVNIMRVTYTKVAPAPENNTRSKKSSK